MIEIKKTGHFLGHTNSIYALQKSLNKENFYTGAADGYIVEWCPNDKMDGVLICRLPSPVYSLHVNYEANQLYAGTALGNMHVIDLIQGAEVRNIEAHTLGLFDIKLCKNNLISIGGNGVINIWDYKNLQIIHTIKASHKSARTIAITPDENEFAIGFSDCTIKIYDATTFALKNNLQAHTNSVFALAFSGNGKYLLSGGRDAMLNVWDAQNNYILLHNIAAHNLHINAIAFNNNDEIFATASMDKTIKIWSASSFKLLKVLDKARHQLHSTSINKLMWHNEQKLLSVSDDRTAMMWDINVPNN